MLVAVLVPVLLLIATVLMERFEAQMLLTRTRRRPVRPPLRLEAAPTGPTAQRHLQPVTDLEPMIVDVGPEAVVDVPLRRAS